MENNTSDLMKNGLVATQVTWELFKRHMQWDNDTPKHILTHQISKVHQEKCVQMLQIQNAKSYSDLEILGNTGSAAAPLSLARASDCFKAGEHIAMLGIGSGINTFMLVFYGSCRFSRNFSLLKVSIFIEDGAVRRLHYYDEGRGGRTIVMVHGNPTWSFLFRRLIISPRKTIESSWTTLVVGFQINLRKSLID